MSGRQNRNEELHVRCAADPQGGGHSQLQLPCKHQAGQHRCVLRYPMLATNMLSPSAEHVAHAAASPHHQLITIDECGAGSCVSSLQTLLNGKGASIAVDGDFGPATLAAVKSFQSSRGLAVRVSAIQLCSLSP